MASISTAAMSVSESAMATLSSSSAAFGSCGAQQLAPLRSPARLNASRIVAVRASRSPKEQSPLKSKALVTLFAAGAPVALNVTRSGSAIALDLNGLIDNVKELSSNIQSSEDEEGDNNSGVELAKRAAQRVATNAARDFASGDADSKSSRLLDSVKELAGNVPSLEGKQTAKDATTDIARNAAAEGTDGATASTLFDAVKALSGKIPGFDGDKVVQDAAVETAKRGAQGAAANAARGLADNAKNRIGKALLNKLTGDDK